VLGALAERSLVGFHYGHRGSRGGYDLNNDFRRDLDEAAKLAGLAATVSLFVNDEREPVKVLVGPTTEYYADAVAWAREAAERGAGEILLTSMDRDGTTAGYDLELTRAVADAVTIPVIASGGAGELAHLPPAIEAGADAVLCASILHYGHHTVAEAKAELAAAGVPVRGAG